MSERFFSSSPITSDHAALDGPEAHHLLHVMRAVVGDRVTLFDNSGAEFTAVVERLGRSNIELKIVERQNIDRELPFPLILGVALPKGDRQKWLVEKLTELGVTKLLPLITERGVAQPTEGAIERLQRTVVEACKQCGRNRLMEIAEPISWPEWVTADVDPRNCCRLIAHPGGVPLSTIVSRSLGGTQIAIGPEGGFTEAEAAASDAAGWQAISLGTQILRVETAAVALAAAISLCGRRG
jgi:16S rRNA (uracil1498-N3)-methyltransferase